jgi:hypothetical protein
MKLSVESFISLTGWIPSGAGASAFALNQVPDFIAGLNPSSCIFHFAQGSNGKSLYKTISFDTTGLDEIVMHFWSRNKKFSGSRYFLSSDFSYKIIFSFGLTDYSFYIPTFNDLVDVSFKIPMQGIITKLTIVCLHDDDDYIILSEMVAVRDEIPRDIFQAVKEQLVYDLNDIYGRVSGGISGKGILIGTASGTTGDKSLLFNDSVKFIQRYAVIMVDDGINYEKHQLDSNDELEFLFNSNYDGKALIHDYSNANVYLVIPVEYGLSEKEIILPSISIWGMNPEEIYQENNKLDTERDSFNDDGVQSQKFQAKFQYNLLLDCEARQNELVAIMSLVVRYFIARQYLWLNGRKIEIFSDGASSFIEPTEGYSEIPKVQYNLRLQIREEVFNREALVKSIQNVVSYELKSN